MPQNFAARRDRLRNVVESLGAEAALVTRLVNVRYLTGFTGSNGAVLVTPDAAVLATDGRYRTQAGEQCPDVDLVIDRAVATALTTAAANAGVRRLGIEEHDVSVELHGALRDVQRESGGGETVRLGHAVERLRVVKDDDEIALLREACAISCRALEDLLPGIAPGRTERSIGRELEMRMLDHGADGVAFETIVATGASSAIPHHRPTLRPVAPGDFLKIDFGALYGGYHADCTRTFVVGAEPAAWQKELHALVFAAQRAGREALAPGVDVADVDDAARRVIKEAGFGDQFPHGLGHGVGLEIHEAPLMGYNSHARLADRTPVTVEPGVYLEGRGGVRIEDTLVVRAAAPDSAGAGTTAELLTMTTKELLVLG